MISFVAVETVPGGLTEAFLRTRALSEALAAPLTDADASMQSMADTSPAKWHLAHTTWFYETFLLRDRLPGYRRFDGEWPFLFNSYYEAEGPRHSRLERGLLSRPSLDDIMAWRRHVDAAIAILLDDPLHADLLALGIAHEQQHQELLLTDIKHAFSRNPLGPAYMAPTAPQVPTREDLAWGEHPGGAIGIGHDHAGGADFSFDNEGPRHLVLLQPFALANRLVSNAEWDEFLADGGYSTPTLWLADGWSQVQNGAIAAPLYWREDEHFTLAGWRRRDPAAPASHISYFEADAFATWAGARLPTEFEWEAAAADEDAAAGNQLDAAAAVSPLGAPGLFGDCWQWTRSAYLPYPRFRAAPGAVGEYNGKFMSGQFVLRGASCATPRGSSRVSYRNFFYPHQRWQFTGLRLARDL